MRKRFRDAEASAALNTNCSNMAHNVQIELRRYCSGGNICVMKPLAFLLTTLLTSGAFAADPDAEQHTKRIRESAEVLTEIMEAKDRSIPKDLLERAHCVGIVPNLKRAGFVVGAKYGKGVITCRNESSVGWSAPSIIRIEGGNIGFQIGLGETDVVFVVLDKRGEDALLKDKFTVGADASVMAGPVGRSADAQTDAIMHAEILAYSRSRGVFAGITLDGATLRPDKDDDRKLYGPGVTQAEILHGNVQPPPGADALYAELDMYAPPK
jgi:lipid-binding SYLF domain-containing protein